MIAYLILGHRFPDLFARKFAAHEHSEISRQGEPA